MAEDLEIQTAEAAIQQQIQRKKAADQLNKYLWI